MKTKIKTETWVAYVIHLILFSTIAYSGIEKWGFNWLYILIAIVLPTIFFIQNIKDYDTN